MCQTRLVNSRIFETAIRTMESEPLDGRFVGEVGKRSVRRPDPRPLHRGGLGPV
jgi:hypothetical protein